MKAWPAKHRMTLMHNAHTESGVIAIEFAFVLIMMLLIIAGTMGFGRAFWYADALTKATRDGARLMSTWQVADISNGATAARNQVIAMALGANVSPALTSANVIVECDNSPPAAPTFTFGACAPGPVPANVRVRINGFTISLSDWFPFVGTDGVIDFGIISLTPHTTMRYMP
jgi:Flp pilus assembly protein TadG